MGRHREILGGSCRSPRAGRGVRWARGHEAAAPGTSPHPERYNPDSWTDEFARLSRPGQREIQAALLYDYRTNVASYPRWQAWLRERKPPMLILWGRYDPSFIVPGAHAYKRDVPSAELHILDAGHFALDEKTEEVAQLTRAFMARLHPRRALH